MSHTSSKPTSQNLYCSISFTNQLFSSKLSYINTLPHSTSSQQYSGVHFEQPLLFLRQSILRQSVSIRRQNNLLSTTSSSPTIGHSSKIDLHSTHIHHVYLQHLLQPHCGLRQRRPHRQTKRLHREDHQIHQCFSYQPKLPTILSYEFGYLGQAPRHHHQRHRQSTQAYRTTRLRPHTYTNGLPLLSG